jgi:hypothetical protein
MNRTMWLVVFCLVSLGAAMAITAAIPRSSSIARPSQNQSDFVPSFALNEAAKSDMLKLPDAPTETESIAPITSTMQAATPSNDPEPTRIEPTKTATIPHWRDANAKVAPATSSPRQINLGQVNLGQANLGHVKRKRPKKKSISEHAASPRGPVWQCRQDAMGSLLRSLDLSPRCDL